ncbi:MAG: hypothetical protein F6K17_37450 [Okeania sp. SIO3C4]|nr:hypothetical protein [Okeania sp. SIO3C4]
MQLINIEFDADDSQAWLDTGTPESLISAEFLDYALEVISCSVEYLHFGVRKAAGAEGRRQKGRKD